jgi:hypothetical protein
MPPRFRRSLIALVFSIASAAATAQHAPNPAREIPAPILRSTGFEVDPYTNGLSIGAMYRPHGAFRRVSWFEDSGFSGSPDDPPGWEKRVVETFDNHGRCVEIENWAMGFRESRTRVDPDTQDETAAGARWDYAKPAKCWRSQCVRDELGRPIATEEVPFDIDGRNPSGAPSRLLYEFTYDHAGHVESATSYSEKGEPTREQSWRYDEAGRVCEHNSRYLPAGPEVKWEYAYDQLGRVATVLCVVRSEPATHRTDFEYEGSSDLVCHWIETLGEHVERDRRCEYDTDHRLIARYTCEGRKRTVEMMDGVDRPLSREVHDEQGQPLESIKFRYEDDDRGNWTQKTEINVFAGKRGSVLRRIEYAD